jgi:hypothetical protein
MPTGVRHRFDWIEESFFFDTSYTDFHGFIFGKNPCLSVKSVSLFLSPLIPIGFAAVVDFHEMIAVTHHALDVFDELFATLG